MTKLTTLKDEEQAVIVHEAGHVAMAIFLNVVPVEVVLGVNDQGLAKVIPEFKGFSQKDNRLRIKVLMAGFLAEKKYTKKDFDHGDSDKSKIRKIAIEDCITDRDMYEIENSVIEFLNRDFDSKVLKLAELIAFNFIRGQYVTQTADLEKIYRQS